MVHLAGGLLEGLDIRLELIVLLGNRLRDEDDNGTDGAEIQRRRSRAMLNFGRTWAGATTTLRRGERVGIRLPSEGTCDPSPQTASVSSDRRAQRDGRGAATLASYSGDSGRIPSAL